MKNIIKKTLWTGVIALNFLFASSAYASPFFRDDITLADLPRKSSAKSGFFFCGIMEEPVEIASDKSKRENSTLE